MSGSLNIAVVVSGPIYGSQDATSAYFYCKAALAAGHRVSRVFFYQDGVTNASQLTVPASDEFDLRQAWCELAETYDVQLDVCVAAALRRGVVDQAESERAELAAYNLSAPFQLSGLGQLAEALLTADRTVQF